MYCVTSDSVFQAWPDVLRTWTWRRNQCFLSAFLEPVIQLMRAVGDQDDRTALNAARPGTLEHLAAQLILVRQTSWASTANELAQTWQLRDDLHQMLPKLQKNGFGAPDAVMSSLQVEHLKHAKDDDLMFWGLIVIIKLESSGKESRRCGLCNIGLGQAWRSNTWPSIEAAVRSAQAGQPFTLDVVRAAMQEIGHEATHGRIAGDRPPKSNLPDVEVRRHYGAVLLVAIDVTGLANLGVAAMAVPAGAVQVPVGACSSPPAVRVVAFALIFHTGSHYCMHPVPRRSQPESVVLSG